MVNCHCSVTGSMSLLVSLWIHHLLRVIYTKSYRGLCFVALEKLSIETHPQNLLIDDKGAEKKKNLSFALRKFKLRNLTDNK